MATPAQIAANRQNALKSTGPRTSEGKDKVRLNSLVHGLRSQDVVLPGEDKQAFDELRRAFLDKYQPDGPDELYCVEKMVTSYWRSRRIPKIEAELFANRASGLAISLIQDPAAWDGFSRLSRYESFLDRAFYRALNEIRRLQAARTQPEPPPPAVEQQPVATTTPEPGIGFARHTPPASPEIGFARQNPLKRYAIDARGRMTDLPPREPAS